MTLTLIVVATDVGLARLHLPYLADPCHDP